MTLVVLWKRDARHGRWTVGQRVVADEGQFLVIRQSILEELDTIGTRVLDAEGDRVAQGKNLASASVGRAGGRGGTSTITRASRVASAVACPSSRIHHTSGPTASTAS